jgi:hypothetical protein
MKSTGKLVYSPRTHLASSERWLVLMCDDEIANYYMKLYQMAYPPYLNGGYSLKLSRAVWGAHVSIIRGEKVPNMNLWGLDANKIIEFEYEPGVIDNGEYYWLKAKCPYLEELRQRYGLPRQPRFGLHLTIGRKTN